MPCGLLCGSKPWVVDDPGRYRFAPKLRHKSEASRWYGRPALHGARQVLNGVVEHSDIASQLGDGVIALLPAVFKRLHPTPELAHLFEQAPGLNQHATNPTGQRQG